MSSTEVVVKRLNESKKASPLKAVNPIIRKYTGHRKGRIKKKLKFTRKLLGVKGKERVERPLKAILPKTSAGDIIVLEPELLPCALVTLDSTTKAVLEPPIVMTNEVAEVMEEKLAAEPIEKEPGSVVKVAKPKTSCGSLVSSVKKIPLKQLKNIETTVGLFEPENPAVVARREENFAEQYLLNVQKRLVGKDNALYNQFVNLMCEFQDEGKTACEVFKTVSEMFSAYPDLAEDFVAFLTPEQAVDCGVFLEHLMLTKMADFLNMIDIYFAKSPHQIKKINSLLELLMGREEVTSEDVTSSVLPLLKGNQVLTDYLLQLLPQGRPPDNLLIDFEELEYAEGPSDGEDPGDDMETIHMVEVEDVYGGDTCPCTCHTDTDVYTSRANHCGPCSTKFVNGKVFKLSGKQLRPAKVVFQDHDVAFHCERLAPKNSPHPMRPRKRSVHVKETLSPAKSCNLSSDELKSDIEDEKGSRTCRNKSLSPKRKAKQPAAVPPPAAEVKVKEEEPAEPCVPKAEPELAEGEGDPWNIEEDRVILQTLQVEHNCEETFRKISAKIPSRSLELIKTRFATLMNMLYEMKAKSENAG